MRSDTGAFRHELKYLINEQEKNAIMERVSMFMQADSHAGNGSPASQPRTEHVNAGYMIRSLYFDDCYECAYEEKLAGVEARSKYRIRIYNYSDSIIKLERKHKEGQYIHKTSATLTRAEVEQIVSGRYGFLAEREERLCREFYFQCALNGMRPKVIVDYDRIPFVYPYGDVRLTFDCGIRAGLFNDNIFDKGLPVMYVMEEGMLIMEVKFTEYLPELIRRLLPVADSAYMAYSKYTMCLEKQKEPLRG